MARSGHFGSGTFAFLKDLAANNRRDWFQANKARYEENLKDPAIRFITDFAPALKRISPHFKADPRPVGGSLFRIYRDTRFSKDKTPYKTYSGIQFRHDAGRDAHAPGFYLHLQPGSCFVGIGVWHPDSATLRRIREFMLDHPARWKRVIGGRRFRGRFDLSGDTLVRAPRGYDPEHPLIQDLKRKDFVGMAPLPQAEVTSADFISTFGEACGDGASFVKFLCDALDLPF